jgi:hypothetical protein
VSDGHQTSGHKSDKDRHSISVGTTIVGCFLPMVNKCDPDTKQHIANMMTVITTSTFALYAAEK